MAGDWHFRDAIIYNGSFCESPGRQVLFIVCHCLFKIMEMECLDSGVLMLESRASIVKPGTKLKNLHEIEQQ